MLLAAGQKLGIDRENLVVTQPDHGEQAFNVMDELVRSGTVSLIVVDSVSALVPRSEIEGDLGTPQVGTTDTAACRFTDLCRTWSHRCYTVSKIPCCLQQTYIICTKRCDNVAVCMAEYIATCAQADYMTTCVMPWCSVQIGVQARLMSVALRKIANHASKCGCCIMFINQLRYKVGAVSFSIHLCMKGSMQQLRTCARQPHDQQRVIFCRRHLPHQGSLAL